MLKALSAPRFTKLVGWNELRSSGSFWDGHPASPAAICEPNAL
jgi:hypothetical protein